ncbi:MAG: 3,4-dihydroxy-2-butanone-4-phosphate synthase [Halobacteriota archaeon]
MNIDAAIEAIRNGKMVLIYDFEQREGETDMVMPAVSMTSHEVARMRLEAGGLICVAVSSEAAECLCLPFMSDILKLVSSDGCHLNLDSICEQPGDLAYDTRSSFSISVNHRRVRTGITDIDRALTIQEIGKIVEQTANNKRTDFGAAFRSPGHVPLLRAAKGLLNERKGQTELSVALANMAGICPAMTVCEMLDARTGKALTKKDSIDYARRNGLIFLTGQAIVDAYEP